MKDALHDWDIPSVASASGVHPGTLYFWLDGTTKAPRLTTMLAVAEVLGFEIVARPAHVTLRLVE